MCVQKHTSKHSEDAMRGSEPLHSQPPLWIRCRRQWETIYYYYRSICLEWYCRMKLLRYHCTKI